MEDCEKRKAVELLKEMRSECNSDEGKSYQGTRLNWMYKGPSDLVDREEYLLGKTIDKTFEMLNSGGNSDVLGRTGEQSNVPKRLLEKTESTEQVDIAKKILEDPLYAIKQKEMEARKKLLNNPVKLKQIKQMLLERNKQNKAHKKKKKKLKKKSEEHLNLLIINKLKKFTDKEKRKALSKIMQSDSSESDLPYPKGRKNKRKRKRSTSSSDESDSSTETTDSSDKDDRTQMYKKKKGKHKKKLKNSKNKSNSESPRSDNKRKERYHIKKIIYKKHCRKSSVSSDYTSSDDSEKDRKLQNKTHNQKSRPEKNHEGRSGSSGSNERDKGNSSIRRKDNYGKRSRKTYGLMMPDGSKPEMKGQTSVRTLGKKVETKAKYMPLTKEKPLSEKERDERLKEMMKNAQQRKEDREKNLESHRKKLVQEEEVKTYDSDFMRRQMLHLTSQGSVADRIKSNINNIQRSKSSMDSNFMKK